MATEKATENIHWAEALAAEVTEAFPNEKEYICAAGISPSGIIHFGNFRDVVTAFAVVRGLAEKEKRTSLLWFWDDLDRFRKVPKKSEYISMGFTDWKIDFTGFEKHIGKPLSRVPNPSHHTTFGKAKSYADLFIRLFEVEMELFGFNIRFVRQSDEYKKGAYNEEIVHALNNRKEIGQILFSLISDKAKQDRSLRERKYLSDYYPISVYSEFTDKDNTRVLDWDASSRSVTYLCLDTDKRSKLPIEESNRATRIKLSWKVDWAMRWKKYGVVMEPFGADHAAPGSSYDASSEVITRVFKRKPPVPQPYGFVGLEGTGKMSGSSGLSIPPSVFLAVYEEPIMQWLYLRRKPTQNFKLAFGSEVIRQYDEFDKDLALLNRGELSGPRKFAIENSFWVDEQRYKEKPIPFRQAIAYGQIVQWNPEKTQEIISSLGLAYDPISISKRLEKAQNWLLYFNMDQMIVLREKRDRGLINTLAKENRIQVNELRKYLSANENASISDLEEVVYRIPKKERLTNEENKNRQRHFFRIVYQLLIGKDTGPRLSTFLWAIDRKKALELLAV